MKSSRTSQATGTWLFSVDVEDVRLSVPDGENYAESAPQMTRRYLEFLAAHDQKATFFVVGRFALRHPDLIAELQSAGHEVACHSHSHIPLDELGVDGFRKDLADNIDALARAGVSRVLGYRAPTCSLTNDTPWAHEILRDHGIRYSSSVLPAANPLYGWPEFGSEPRMTSGVLEIPITVSDSPFIRLPFAGGIYFRVLPFFLTKRWFRRKLRSGDPVVSYLHPYDIDDGQERFMHPGINRNRVYNRLMYVNRKRVISRLNKVMDLGYSIKPYSEYYLDASGRVPRRKCKKAPHDELRKSSDRSDSGPRRRALRELSRTLLGDHSGVQRRRFVEGVPAGRRRLLSASGLAGHHRQ